MSGRSKEMMRKFAVSTAALFILVLAGICAAQQEGDILNPQVSGKFYPKEPEVLARMVDGFIEEARVPEIDGRIIALISPHAGYRYSGAVAGHGYRAIRNAGYKTVIVVAFNHRWHFEGASVYDRGGYKTPLGVVEVDTKMAGELIAAHEKIRYYLPGFIAEHSLETQIPFLQRSLKDFRIVPIVFGDSSYASCQVLAKAIKKVTAGRDDVLIVASTDMSHFHPYDEAVRMDRECLDVINTLDVKLLRKKISGRSCELCGIAPVTTVLLAVGGMEDVRIATLKYANSGDVTGDRSKVVGYGSLAVYRQRKDEPAGEKKEPAAGKKEGQQGGAVSGKKEKEEKKKEDKKMLNDDQKRKLLKIARSSIEEYLRSGQKITLDENDPDLKQAQGAFVTLKRGETLRGCIGNLAASTPLYETVREMAIAAACGDPRFPGLGVPELKEVMIEISVLSPLEKIDSAEEIKIGEHGVLVRKDFASGVFLPQVATETGWTKEEFLSNLCSHKAGLPPDAWKKGDIDIYVFTAEVFSENELIK